MFITSTLNIFLVGNNDTIWVHSDLVVAHQIRTWSEYFHTFQCIKRVEINLLIPLHKSKKYTFQLFLYIHRSQNMQKYQYL